MHKLIIEDDEGKAVVVPLIRDEISIGRQEGNTIRLTERNVSRRHARLVRREGRYLLEDVGSHIGTRINGAPIKGQVPLNDGDQIVIGDYKLAIKIERPTTTTLGYPNMPLPAAGASATVTPVAGTPATAAAPAAAPAPEAAMEGAPTIPVRTLADQGLVPSAAPEAGAPAATAPARLMVMTAPLAGQEFLLDRASVVIGRTQENDIVLNHKSISRHHAKIIRDGDRYVVVDLESANGVRVNGAEYERVELQSGDVVELGHVRLRFATADDAGTFDNDFRFGANRKPLFIGAGAAVVLIVGAVVLFSGGSKKEVAKPVEPPKPAVVATPTPPPPKPAPSQPEAPAVSEETKQLLAEAKKAYGEQRWGDALVSLDKAVTLSTVDVPEAVEIRKAVEAERENAARFAAMQHAADTKDYAAVIAGLSGISDGSFYRARAVALEEESRGKLIARHLSAAEKRSARGDCVEVRKEAGAVLEVDAQNKVAQDLIARCDERERAKAAVAAAPKPAPATVAVAPKPAPATATPPAPKPAPTTVAVAPKPAPSPAAPAPRPAPATRPEPPATTATPPAPKPVAVATTAPAAATPAAPKPTGARPAAARVPAATAAPVDADALLQEAQDAWINRQYSAAIDASRKALKVKPGLPRAYQIIAVCSCSLRDAESATKAYERLDDRSKQMVKTLCQKSGVTIE